MSAPPSGSSGSSSSPAPGYYPDPSIPNYIRYWNGSAWVPGTSRPAPADPSAAGPARTPAVDESGPMFLDADPTAPEAVQGPTETAPPAGGPGTSAPPVTGPAGGWPEPAAHEPPPAAGAQPFWGRPGAGQQDAGPGPAWPAPAQQGPGAGMPPISWGAAEAQQAQQAQQAPQVQPQPQPPVQPQAEQFSGRPPYQQQSAPVVPMPVAPERPLHTTPSPIGATPVEPDAVPHQAQPPWPERVQELARDGAPAPWRPVAADPFASARSHDHPAGLVRRFVALLIDAVLFLAVVGAAALPLGSAAYHHAKDKVDAAKLTGETVKVWLLDSTTGAEAGGILAAVLVAGILLEVLPTANWGSTLGKKLMGLRVLDIEGQLPPSFGVSLRRWLLRTVLNALVVGLVGMAWALVDRPWRQSWHDKASRTFVAKS